MPDLSTTYLGMNLKNPVVVSSSPLQKDLDNIRRMEDAGAAAVVLHSLFEEQIRMESHELDRRLEQGTESFAESLSFFPDLQTYNLGPEGYLEHLARAKRAVGIPIIGSLNGVSTGGWTNYARMMEEAGADAIELNIYYHYCPVKSRTGSIGCDLRVSCLGSPMLPRPVKWALSRTE